MESSTHFNSSVGLIILKAVPGIIPRVHDGAANINRRDRNEYHAESASYSQMNLSTGKPWFQPEYHTAVTAPETVPGDTAETDRYT